MSRPRSRSRSRKPSSPASSSPTVSTESSPAADGSHSLLLEILPQTFGICRLKSDNQFPEWARHSDFLSISRSPDELSIVCDDAYIPRRLRCERGRRALRVAGTLDFSLVGVLAAMASPLAEAKISIFVVSTFDTDYLLVPGEDLDRAIDVLRRAGHRFDGDEEKRSAEKRSAEKRSAEKRSAEKRSETKSAEAKSPSSKTKKAKSPKEESASDSEPEKLRKPRRRSSAKAEAAPETEAKAEAKIETNDAEAADAEEKPAKKKRTRRRKASEKEAEPEAKAEIAEAEEKPVKKKRTRRRKTDEAEAPEAEAKNESAESASGDESEEKPTRKKRTRRKRAAESEEIAPEPKRASKSKKSESAEDDEKRERKPRRRKKDEEDEGAEAQDFFTGGIQQNALETTDATFVDLGLAPEIAETIRAAGFIHPTPVQAGVIPHSLQDVDVIGLAETGSGKTAAFCLPLAEKLLEGSGVRGLILCPTREIALQTQAFLKIFARDHELETAVVIGGVKMQPQINALKRKPDIIVATPGRLADHMRRRNVSLAKLKMLVLDEADHMLDLGFLPQIKEILEQIPEKRQTMMFSATMPKPIARLTQRFMNDPVTVDLRPSGRTAEGIEHRLYLVDENDKKACLLQLLRDIEGSTLIFMRRKLHTEWLSRQIESAGFNVERIHSDRSQGQRVNALRSIREGDNRVLVATDVAARGIDLPLIEHVINYDLPEQLEDYVHRAGRTARGNNQGIVSSIATWKDKIMIGELERGLELDLPRCSVDGVKPYQEIKRRKTVRRRRLL